MRIVLLIDGKRHAARLPHEGADVAHVGMPCPLCRKPAPLVVQGADNHIGGHDFYKAVATAQCCLRVVGELRVYVDTIFGLEEDEAMLKHGRARVYRAS